MQTSPSDQIAEKIRQIMKDKRLSQMALADALGSSQPAVSRRLRGRVQFTISELEQFAGALGVPLSELISAAPAAS